MILGAGKEYYGSITEIEPDHFEIAEVDLNQRMTFDYKDVKKVRKGYGGHNFITGKRVNPRASMIATIVFVGGLFTLVAAAFSQAKD